MHFIPTIQRSLLIASLSILFFCVPCLKADVVTLKDGTVYEGVVIEETSARVTIEITIANIKTTKSFPRYKVKSIERKPVESLGDEYDNGPSTTDDSGKNDSETKRDSRDRRSKPLKDRPSRVSAADRTQFMVIPVTGQIGVETNSNGLRKALTQAAKRKINHVVFQIDSGGGFVYDAVETLSILKEFDDQLTYHALVEGGAISAASVYVAAADDIFVRSDSRVGGAVAYSTDNTSGAAEVDAKFNSIWAAEIAARAESKGFPAEIFRAMVVLEAEVWMDEEGKVYSSRPRTGGEQIDSRSTILTIRAAQMVKAGMATEFDGELTELGELLGIENWSIAKGMGERIMLASGKQINKLQDKFNFAIKTFAEQQEIISENDPTSFGDYRAYLQNNGTRVPDGNSIRLWRQRSLTCIRSLDIMLEALGEIAKVNKSAKKINALHLDIVPNEIGDEAYKELQKQRDWLNANKDSIPPSVLNG